MYKGKLLWQSVRYQLRSLIRPVLIFLGVYIIVQFLIMFTWWNDGGAMVMFNHLLGFRPEIADMFTLFLTPLFLACSVLLIVIALKSFRQDFNHLSMLNMTRKTQFAAGLISSIVTVIPLSAICLVFSIAETLITFRLAAGEWPKRFIIKKYVYLAGFSGQISKDLIFATIFYLSLFFFALTLGDFIGVLIYRLGRRIFLPVWLSVGLVFCVFPIWGFNQPGELINFQMVVVNVGPGYLFAAAVVLRVISFIAMRKMPLTIKT